MTTHVCRPLAVACGVTISLIADCKLVLSLPVDHSLINSLPLDRQIDQSTSCLMHTLAPTWPGASFQLVLHCIFYNTVSEDEPTLASTPGTQNVFAMEAATLITFPSTPFGTRKDVLCVVGIF